MCGIAGIVGDIDYRAAESIVRKMTHALIRRGPDSGGIKAWDEAVLGHRRLAIFDLSEAGHQPMVSTDCSVGVVFNGSIYNYRELRKELLAYGAVFRSNTDTEVLIHGYREWGIDKLVSKLRGMFAFGLWDNWSRKLYLVRDRLGVKPLVFSLYDGIIIFASTIRALHIAGIGSDLDESAVIKFLEFGFIPDDRSIYRGIVKVPAATIVEWSDGALSQRQYWTPPTVIASRSPSFSEAVEETERLLLHAVEARLHADVPVGALLSGGIDSALVCWAVTQLGGDVTTYTIGTHDDPGDETISASVTAQVLGIRHRVLEMSDWDTPEIEELVSAYAEPFACASALGMLRVSRVVSSSAKVLLTGDGGDDVFLGYPRHRHLWLAGKLSQISPCFMKKAWRVSRSAFPQIGPLRRVAALFDYTTGGLAAYVDHSRRLLIDQANSLLGDRLVGFPLDCSDIPWSTDAGHRALADFLEYERKTRFVGEYMTKVDGATMHYGLEARSPFLDQALWEFASSLSFDLRLYQGRLKAILRELVHRKIGGEIAKRKKSGFSVPVQRWAIDRWRPQIEAALHESVLEREGWIRSRPLLDQLDFAACTGFVPYQIWYFFVFELWMRHEQSKAA